MNYDNRMMEMEQLEILRARNEMADERGQRMTDNCPSGYFGAHKFQPRFDLGPSTWKPESYVGFRAAEHIEAYREKIYVHDICVRCGKIINREKQEQ